MENTEKTNDDEPGIFWLLAFDPNEWTRTEIIYISVGGVLVLMALAEIIAFTGSLTYSFLKVHSKAKVAGQRGVQYLSLVILVVFWGLRILFLSAMFSLLPIPHWQNVHHLVDPHEYIPRGIITMGQYTAFGLVASLLVLPAITSMYQLMSSPSDVKEQIDAIRTTSTFPRVLIVMPVYNELPEVLHVAICSAIDGDYPKEHLHIFISFDNDATSDLYRALIRNLGIPADNDYYPPVLDIYFRGVQITVSRFPHGGKRLTQKKTFGLINSIYKEYPEKTDHLFVLFIDSDILLHPATIANFVWDMQLKPGSTKDLLAMTGVITVTTKDDMSFINLLQDIEYVHGQFFGRAIESAVGGCITLPGALTIFRYSAFLKSYDEYFAERSVSDLWDFGRSHLGEDRYLTHLLMSKASRTKMIQFSHRALCKTEPVREWANLLKQRRRWFLGFLTNEGALLSDPALWIKYPLLLTFRLVQDVVMGTSMVSYAVLVAIMTGMQHWSWVWLGLLIAYFAINWAVMVAYGVWLGRYKAWLYPILFIAGPPVTWFLMVYGVITANERTWGGPRADKAADAKADDGEAGENEESTDSSRSARDPHDPDDHEECLELPDHLFYPQSQGWSHRRPSSPDTMEDDSDVHSLNMGDAQKVEPGPNAKVKQPRPPSSSSTIEPGLYELALEVESVRHQDSWEGDEDSSEDEDDHGFPPGKEELTDEYFNYQPLGFASVAKLSPDTAWWEDDGQLSNLGIMPFVHQPKIPAMFASTETLILSPVLPARRQTMSSVKTDSGASPRTYSYTSRPSSRPGTPGLPSPAMSPLRRPSSSSSTLQSLMPLPPGYFPSPQPSFRYIPAAYITPANSAPSTPRISPTVLPSARVPHSPGNNSIPAMPSSSKVLAPSGIPSSIIAAALAIPHPHAGTTRSIRRMSSRLLALQQESGSYPMPMSIPLSSPASMAASTTSAQSSTPTVAASSASSSSSSSSASSQPDCLPALQPITIPPRSLSLAANRIVN